MEQQGKETMWASDPWSDPWRNPQSNIFWNSPIYPQRATPPPPAPATTPTWGRIILLSVVIAVLAGLVGGALGYGVADLSSSDSSDGQLLSRNSQNTSPLAERPPGSVAEIVSRVQPAVVTVLISGTSGASGNGSGFLISQDGYILTNAHVATAADESSLSVLFSDGSSLPATVVGADIGSDVAVLQVERDNPDILDLGDSDTLQVGDPVITFGAPLGLSGTVTTGIVSALDRPVVTGGRNSNEAYMAAVQTDAAINPGNSGGPLVDGSGNVVGINSAIYTAPGSQGNIGLGFAIPINHAARIAQELIKNGEAKTTIIGATVASDTAASGARIKDVAPDGPAAAAGIQTDDVIKKFGDHVIDDSTALIALIRKEAPETEVTVEYERDGTRQSASVKLTSK